MKRSQATFLLILTLLILAGCAATAPVKVEKREIKELAVDPAVKPAAETVTLPRFFADRELLLEGVANLNRSDRPDPAAARKIFSTLIQNHPQSRWRSAAETFIRLIDEGEASRESIRREHLLMEQAQTEQAKSLQENDRLKKTVRELTEKLHAETAALALENEQLKKDLQRLKALEIELQKRERMLR
jgi:hypothetical protein